MDKHRHNSSAYSVPETMQDVTLNSTPLPQAASTAVKTVQLVYFYLVDLSVVVSLNEIYVMKCFND